MCKRAIRKNCGQVFVIAPSWLPARERSSLKQGVARPILFVKVT